MTNSERIVAFLAERPNLWFDDDELARILGIQPRQQVNQICRRLADAGRILREPRDGKVRHRIALDADLSTGPSPAETVKDEPPAVSVFPTSHAAVATTPAGFEELARRVMRNSTRLFEDNPFRLPSSPLSPSTCGSWRKPEHATRSWSSATSGGCRRSGCGGTVTCAGTSSSISFCQRGR